MFLQKQEVTLWSLFGAAINHTIKTGQRALLLLKGNLSQTVKKLQRSTESLLAGLVEAPPPTITSQDSETHADGELHMAERSERVCTRKWKIAALVQPTTGTGSNTVHTNTHLLSCETQRTISICRISPGKNTWEHLPPTLLLLFHVQRCLESNKVDAIFHRNYRCCTKGWD